MSNLSSFRKFLESTETADFKQVVELLAAASQAITSLAIKEDTPITEEMLLAFQMAGDILKNSGNDLKGDWIHGFIPRLQEYVTLPDASMEQDDKWVLGASLRRNNVQLNQCITAYQNVGFFGFYRTNQFKPPIVLQEFFIHIPMNPVVERYPFMPENTEDKPSEAWGASVLVPVDPEVVAACMDSAMGVNQYSQTVKRTNLCSLDKNSLFKPNSYSYINLGRLKGHIATQFRAVNPVLEYAAEGVPYSGEVVLNGRYYLTTGGVQINGEATNYNLQPAVLDFIEKTLETATDYAIVNDIEYYHKAYVACSSWEGQKSPW